MDCPTWSKDEGKYVFEQSRHEIIVEEMITDLDSIKNSRKITSATKNMVIEIQESLEELKDNLE